VLAHDRLDSLGGLVGIVKGNGADIVVENVGLYDAMEKLAANEAKLAVNGSSSSTDVCPGLAVVMRKRGVSVLEVGNSNLKR
jgi:hypothetical protein